MFKTLIHALLLAAFVGLGAPAAAQPAGPAAKVSRHVPLAICSRRHSRDD